LDLVEELGRPRFFELGMIEHRGRVTLWAEAQRAVFADAERPRLDFAGRYQVRIVSRLPERVRYSKPYVFIRGTSPVHRTGVTEYHRDGTVEGGAGNQLDEADSTLASDHVGCEQMRTARKPVHAFRRRVDGMVIDSSATQGVRPQAFFIGGDVRCVELIVPDAAAPLFGQ